MLQALSVETSYGKVFGMSAGSVSSPLILGIHGWSQRNGWHTWEPVLQLLAEAGYFAVSVDMPGWGQSQMTGASSLGINEAVTTALDIVRGVDKDIAVIMGKSWGGGVAFQLALEHPETVSKLIVTAPAYKDIASLRKLVQPVLMAWAEDDGVIPIKYAADYKASIRDLEFVSFKTGGHSAAPKNAVEFAPLAVKFLSKAIVKTAGS